MLASLRRWVQIAQSKPIRARFLMPIDRCGMDDAFSNAYFCGGYLVAEINMRNWVKIIQRNHKYICAKCIKPCGAQHRLNLITPIGFAVLGLSSSSCGDRMKRTHEYGMAKILNGFPIGRRLIQVRRDEEKTLTTGRSHNHSGNLGSPHSGNELGKTYRHAPH